MRNAISDITLSVNLQEVVREEVLDNRMIRKRVDITVLATLNSTGAPCGFGYKLYMGPLIKRIIRQLNIKLKRMANLFTKESIKARMFKQAATLYDIRNIDGMDPLIRLLIEALSGEIFKLSGDMHAIESRLLEKVASALTPHTALVAKPAHAIAAARPIYTASYCISHRPVFL